MRIYLLEHEVTPHSSHVDRWAEDRGHTIKKSHVPQEQALFPVEDFDWLVIFGGSQHIYESGANPWLPRERKLVSQALAGGRVILGICLGAQILAEALGGRVFLSDVPEIGWYDITLTEEGSESFLFRNMSECFEAFHWHRDHFSLPPGCTRLASSEPTPNQAFCCESRPVVGLQFHPELTPEMIRYYCGEQDEDPGNGPYVTDLKTMSAQAGKAKDAQRLMVRLLDNMVDEFS